MSSIIRGSDNFDSEGIIEGTATAWVNFNGTGTVAIRDSYNVSSITDNGTGNYVANFNTTMANSNYSVVGAGSLSDAVGATAQCITPRSLTTSNVNVKTDYNNSVYLDFANIFVSVFGGV